MMCIISVQVLPCAVTVAATAARVTIYPNITSQVHSSCPCLLILTETVIVFTASLPLSLHLHLSEFVILLGYRLLKVCK